MAETLEAAFQRLANALATGDLEGFYGMMLEDAVIMDEDLPFISDRAGFRAHIDFHLDNTWENFGWQPHQMRFATTGRTGVASGFAMFRGKPRDAGFRLRPMMFLQGWTDTADGWRLASWHQSPVVGHVTRQSPA